MMTRSEASKAARAMMVGKKATAADAQRLWDEAAKLRRTGDEERAANVELIAAELDLMAM